MALQNNFYKINSSVNLAATTTSGATRSSACPANVTLVRISSTALAYVACIAGQGATPTAAVASGVQVDVSDSEIFVIRPGDTIAAITGSNRMATNKKITELTELTEADLSDNDVLAIVDISEDTTHKVRKSTLAAALSGVSQVEATTPIAVNQTTGEVTVSISSTPTFGTVDLTADTSTGDNAAIGYTAAEGLILTGQGSTNDVTIKNDADADVLEIPTGTTNVTVVGSVTAASLAGSGSGLTAGTTPITTLDIDGGTDIGEGIVDADLWWFYRSYDYQR